MILQCPECNARYVVPDRAVGAEGRTVRCAKCAHSWFQAPAAPPEEQATTPAVAPALPDLDKVLEQINAQPKPIPKGSNLPAVKKKRGVPIALKIVVGTMGATAAVLALLAFAPGALSFKSTVGLQLGATNLEKITEDRHTYYKISGEISNGTAGVRNFPTLRVTLVDDSGHTLQSWNFRGHGKVLTAGEHIPFTTGNLDVTYTTATRFVVELGNGIELALRRKPS